MKFLILKTLVLALSSILIGCSDGGYYKKVPAAKTDKETSKPEVETTTPTSGSSTTTDSTKPIDTIVPTNTGTPEVTVSTTPITPEISVTPVEQPVSPVTTIEETPISEIPTPTTTPAEVKPTLNSKQEVFAQVSNPVLKFDILWVIDNSKSMREEQEALAYNFERFISEFIEKDVDFKMAITTTSTNVVAATQTSPQINNRGRAVKNSIAKLTSAQAKMNKEYFMNDFKKMIQVGITGSAREKGLDASVGFLERYPTFSRAGSKLVVIYVSDENDQSTQTPSQILGLLKTKSKSNAPVAYSIVDVNLSGNLDDMTVGFDRYDYVSKNSGGLTLDIKSEFADSLSSIGDSIINLMDSYLLTNEPIKGSVIVSINGEKIDSQAYEVKGKRVQFRPEFVPSVDSKIEIDYRYEAN